MLRRGRRDLASRSSSRSASRRASSGSVASAILRRSSADSLPRSCSSPSSCWIERSCSRRKYSRCVLVIRPWVSAAICCPSSRTDSSRWRISISRRSLASTGSSSRISCRAAPSSGTGRRDQVGHLPRIGDDLGGRATSSGTSDEAPPGAGRDRARRGAGPSDLRRLSVWSSAASTRATRYGSVAMKSSSRIRSRPCTISRTVPSGARMSWWMTAAVPIGCRSSGPGSLSSSRCATRASMRLPRITSSTSWTERGSPTVSGTTASGSTTASRSGKTGSVSGMTKSAGPAPASAAISGPSRAWAA